MILEKITLWVATEDYGMDHGITGLDYIIPALEKMDSECNVFDYSSEDYKLVPKTNCNGHQETVEEYEKRVEELDGKPCNCGSEVKG